MKAGAGANEEERPDGDQKDGKTSDRSAGRVIGHAGAPNLYYAREWKRVQSSASIHGLGIRERQAQAEVRWCATLHGSFLGSQKWSFRG